MSSVRLRAILKTSELPEIKHHKPSNQNLGQGNDKCVVKD
jgi:hypothetical protein